jgi:hypothetical protein
VGNFRDNRYDVPPQPAYEGGSALYRDQRRAALNAGNRAVNRRVALGALLALGGAVAIHDADKQVRASLELLPTPFSTERSSELAPGSFSSVFAQRFRDSARTKPDALEVILAQQTPPSLPHVQAPGASVPTLKAYVPEPLSPLCYPLAFALVCAGGAVAGYAITKRQRIQDRAFINYVLKLDGFRIPEKTLFIPSTYTEEQDNGTWPHPD